MHTLPCVHSLSEQRRRNAIFVLAVVPRLGISITGHPNSVVQLCSVFCPLDTLPVLHTSPSLR